MEKIYSTKWRRILIRIQGGKRRAYFHACALFENAEAGFKNKPGGGLIFSGALT